jgi:hypothetical protein
MWKNVKIMLKKCGSCLLPLKAWLHTTSHKQKKKWLFTAPPSHYNAPLEGVAWLIPIERNKVYRRSFRRWNFIFSTASSVYLSNIVTRAWWSTTSWKVTKEVQTALLHRPFNCCQLKLHYSITRFRIRAPSGIGVNKLPRRSMKMKEDLAHSVSARYVHL